MLSDSAAMTPCRFEFEVGDVPAARPSQSRARVELQSGRIEQGVVKLVLSLVELLRQVMEKQAMRRIDAGALDADEIDRVGRGLMELESTIRSLQAQFRIGDLNIDLGPVGTLLDKEP